MTEKIENEIPGERLQKVLAQAGVGSRREMEEWIGAGRVLVNGKVASLGMRVVAGDKVQVDGRFVKLDLEEEQALPRVLIYHKQEGEIVVGTIPRVVPVFSTVCPNCAGRSGSPLGAWISIPVVC